MSTNSTPYVLEISEPSGAGKTAVVLQLKDVLQDSVAIFFDEYDRHTLQPASFRDWVAEGADYNAWKTPSLTTDLHALKRAESIQHPLDGRPIHPGDIILFDAPLGYAHQETGSLIDFMVFLDTPLDVAMARRILRDDGSSEFSVHDELKSYLDYGRNAYLEMDKQVKPTCDLVVDSSAPINVIASAIADVVLENLEKNKGATGRC